MSDVEVDNLNEKSLENAVVQFGEEILDRLNSAEDFVIEQAPLFVQEYLNWYFYSSLFSAIVSAVLILVLLTIVRVSYKYVVNCESDEFGDNSQRDLVIGIGMVIPLAASLMIVAPLLVNIRDMVKVCVAPRVVLVELIRSMI